MLPKTVGPTIRYFRMARKMSLRKLAEHAGLTAPFLSDLEHDRRNTDHLDRIAEILQIDEKLLRDRDGRISPGVIEWLRFNPEYLRLLEDIKESQKTAEEIRELIW